ncbi:MAG: HD domain-containing protein [Candidatus Nitronauta litoralis]|uniref:HD domain-containing protein n=1 Tax=Candidatus Nitronauta litoralis TaxID=2705533 RepID=A0A7T0BUY0_9BACT|nr:MAG: HD domain-containing protein [Candidatus Nitronauta litoralis]
MSDTIEHYFKPINHTFLDKTWVEGFTIYYKSWEGKKVSYLTFAEYTPRDYTRLQKIMKEGDRQEFYIHENDLIRYYRQCVMVRLREKIEKENPNSLELVRRTYPVIRRILSDYLDFKISSRMFRALDELPDILCPVFKNNSIPFPALAGITFKDGKIETHCTNIGMYSLYFGKILDFNEKELREIFLGGLFSDIGKKDFPEHLESKKELSNEDWSVIRKHPSSGRKTLNDMKCYSENILRMVAEHHENFDGSGYPFGLTNEKISLNGRIARILDVFNSMTCERPYRKPAKVVETLTEIKDHMEGHFDPRLLTALFKSFTHS